MAYRQTAKTKARQLAVRQSIIDSAIELITRHGFASVSIRRVAENASLATGSVYKHFTSKADLSAQAFRIASQAELARVVAETQGGGNPSERLQMAVKGFCERAIKQPRLAYALIAEPVDQSVDLERIELRRDYANAFANLITEGIERREFAQQPANICGAALVGIIAETLVGPLSWKNKAPSRAEQDELIEVIQTLCLAAVAVKPA